MVAAKYTLGLRRDRICVPLLTPTSHPSVGPEQELRTLCLCAYVKFAVNMLSVCYIALDSNQTELRKREMAELKRK